MAWARWRGALCLAAAALVACDEKRVEKLEEGVATEAQVRQQFGEPAAVTTEPDGSRSFEYPRQPEGWTNYLIKIGPDGKMSSLRQLLNEDNFARVASGMTQLQVRAMLGRPAKTWHFDLKNEDVWDWRFKYRNNESKVFSATFAADGKVTTTATTDEVREGGR